MHQPPFNCMARLLVMKWSESSTQVGGATRPHACIPADPLGGSVSTPHRCTLPEHNLMAPASINTVTDINVEPWNISLFGFSLRPVGNPAAWYRMEGLPGLCISRIA